MAVSDPNKFASVGNVKALFETGDGFINTTNYADRSVTLSKLAQDVLDRILPTLGEDLGSYSWGDLVWMVDGGMYEPSDFAYMVGQVKPIDIAGYGSQDFVLIGTGHDDLVGGGKAFLTFQSKNIVLNRQLDASSAEDSGAGWGTCDCRAWLNSTFKNAFPDEIKQAMKTVVKKYITFGNRMGDTTSTSNDDIFIASMNETAESHAIGYDDGTRYAYWAEHSSSTDRIKKSGGRNAPWWTRSTWDGDGSGMSYYIIGMNGSIDGGDRATETYGIVPCFCI